MILDFLLLRKAAKSVLIRLRDVTYVIHLLTDSYVSNCHRTKKNSSVWEFFKEYDVDDRKLWECVLCKEVEDNKGNTSNL